MRINMNGDNVRITMVPKYEAEKILDPTKPIRSLYEIIRDIIRIDNRGSAAVNLTDAKKLEVLGLELIRHARETMTASY